MLCLIKHLSPQVRCHCRRQVWWPWGLMVQPWCLNGRSCLIGHHLRNHLLCTTNPSTPSHTGGWLDFWLAESMQSQLFLFGEGFIDGYIYIYMLTILTVKWLLIMYSTASSYIFTGYSTIEELLLWCLDCKVMLYSSNLTHVPDLLVTPYMRSWAFTFLFSFFLPSGFVLQSSFLLLVPVVISVFCCPQTDPGTQYHADRTKTYFLLSRNWPGNSVSRWQD